MAEVTPRQTMHQDKPMTITRDTRTDTLVGTLPGVLDALPCPSLDAIELDADVDVDAYRRRLAPIIAELTSSTILSTRCQKKIVDMVGLVQVVV